MNRKEKEQKAIKLYTEGRSCPKIAQILHIHRKSVYRILERHNIELRPPLKKKCLFCDNQIFVEKQKNSNCCGTCSTHLRRYRTKKRAVEYKGGECEDCGWSGNIVGFDFHHLDATKKDFEVNSAVIASMSWDRVAKELDKCKLLCAICHRIEHARIKDEMFLSIADKID